MKKIQFNIFAFLALFLAFTACEEEETYQEYLNGSQLPTDLSYDVSAMTSFLTGEVISVTPTHDYKALVNYSLNDTILYSGDHIDALPESFNGFFDIDTETGVITAKNLHNLQYGTYTLDVKMNTPAGVATFEKVWTLNLIELLFNFDVTPSSNEFSFDHEGELFTSAVSNLPEGVTITGYELINPIDGISIDPATGIISKDAETAFLSGAYNVSVRVNTSEVNVDFIDVATFNIAKNPVITSSEEVVKVLQSEGTTAALTTKDVEDYTALDLVVTDMEGNATTALDGSISFDRVTGVITLVTPESDYVAASYNISINATGSPTLADQLFENIFVLKITEPASVSYPLSMVTLSPWNGYTVSPTSLAGIEAGINLTIQTTLAGVTIDGTTGQITVPADQNYAEGEHSVTVVAGDNTFEDLFTIKIAKGEAQELYRMAISGEEGFDFQVESLGEDGTDILPWAIKGGSDFIRFQIKNGPIGTKHVAGWAALQLNVTDIKEVNVAFNSGIGYGTSPASQDFYTVRFSSDYDGTSNISTSTWGDQTAVNTGVSEWAGGNFATWDANSVDVPSTYLGADKTTLGVAWMVDYEIDNDSGKKIFGLGNLVINGYGTYEPVVDVE